jgi:protease I
MNNVDQVLAIGKTMQDYFDGMHFGETRRLRKAFHPDAYLFGYYHGEFSRISLEEWMTEVEATPKPSESGEVFDMRIVSMDITGRTAVVRVSLLYTGLRYIDYLSLMQFDDSWKIIHKTYHSD